MFIDRVGRIHTGDVTTRLMSARVLTSVLEPDARRAELEDHGIAEYVRALTKQGSLAPQRHGIAQLTPREKAHLWISAALYGAAFVALCVWTWRADGTEAFAMGTGALFTLAIVFVMFKWPQEYNDHLGNWYTRQGLVKSPLT